MKDIYKKTILICVFGFSTFSAKSYAGAEVDDFIDINQSFLTWTNIYFNNGLNSADIDWAISNNFYGGGEFAIVNYLSFGDDRPSFVLSPGSPVSSFFMDSGGRVGLGTTIPGGPFGSKLTVGTDDLGGTSIHFQGITQDYLIGGDSVGFGIIDATSQTIPFSMFAGAPDDSIVIAASSNVGIGTFQPTAKLHVLDGNLKIEQSTAATSAILDFATATSNWEIKQNGDTGRLTFFSPGGAAVTASFKFDRAAQENLLRVGVVAGDTVDINGKLVINGSNVTPDYVFDPEYQLESIEEHTEFMWKNKHLPALPGASANEEGVDIVSHQYGTLEELEKAHIYISQLHTALKELQLEVADLKKKSNNN